MEPVHINQDEPASRQQTKAEFDAAPSPYDNTLITNASQRDSTQLEFDLSNHQITSVNSEKQTYNLQNGVGHMTDLVDFPEMNGALNEQAIEMDAVSYAYEPVGLLPHIKSDTGNKHISVKTLKEATNGKFKHLLDHFIIIDCRYAHEFNGGHINGALNIQTPKLLELLFKANVTNSTKDHRTAWVFHCEYSQKRGPRAAAFFRSLDRKFNEANYPNLCFPHCYVLDGGYKNYFDVQVDGKTETNNRAPDGKYTYISMFNEGFDTQMLSAEKLDKVLWPLKKERPKKMLWLKQVTFKKVSDLEDANFDGMLSGLSLSMLPSPSPSPKGTPSKSVEKRDALLAKTINPKLIKPLLTKVVKPLLANLAKVVGDLDKVTPILAIGVDPELKKPVLAIGIDSFEDGLKPVIKPLIKVVIGEETEDAALQL